MKPKYYSAAARVSDRKADMTNLVMSLSLSLVTIVSSKRQIFIKIYTHKAQS